MLSDKQIQKYAIEIAKSVATYSSTINIHPFGILTTAVGALSSLKNDQRQNFTDNCKQWLFDNQESYPFSITKQDMLY